VSWGKWRFEIGEMDVARISTVLARTSATAPPNKPNSYSVLSVSPLAFLRPVPPFQPVGLSGPLPRGRVVAFTAEHVALLDRLDEELRLAREPAHAHFTRLKTSACPRLLALGKSAAVDRLERLVAEAAWTEAAIDLIELEIPRWTLRRVVHENCEWHCSLSRQPNSSLELDDMAQASHEVLPLAVLRAFFAARTRDVVAPHAISAVPHIRLASDSFVHCCDNYA
jgi:hypothetical protein